MSHEQLSPRTLAAYFAATFGITAAGAVLLGPDTMGWTVISLGILSIVAAVVLERIAPMTEVKR